MGYSTINKTKWGICSTCGGNEQEVVKVKKDLFCLPCRNNQKAQEQVKKSNRRNTTRRIGFKLRNSEIPPIATEDYAQAGRQNLMQDCDYTFSRIVRMMGADKSGIGSCYTCNRLEHWSMQDCGHYQKRGNTQLRWDLRNARPQCKTCNQTNHGNYEEFTARLELEYQGLPEQLREIASTPYKWGRDELKQLLLDLRQKLRIIETKFTQPKN